jgi:hypothetical protein
MFAKFLHICQKIPLHFISVHLNALLNFDFCVEREREKLCVGVCFFYLFSNTVNCQVHIVLVIEEQNTCISKECWWNTTNRNDPVLI